MCSKHWGWIQTWEDSDAGFKWNTNSASFLSMDAPFFQTKSSDTLSTATISIWIIGSNAKDNPKQNFYPELQGASLYLRKTFRVKRIATTSSLIASTVNANIF